VNAYFFSSYLMSAATGAVFDGPFTPAPTTSYLAAPVSGFPEVFYLGYSILAEDFSSVFFDFFLPLLFVVSSYEDDCSGSLACSVAFSVAHDATVTV
jgi:hypothetical protein